MSNTKDGVLNEVVGHTDDHVYMTVRIKKEVFLRKMDLSYRTVYQSPIPLKVGNEEQSLHSVKVFGDRILVFSTVHDKREKTRSMYLRVFDEVNMKPLGRKQRIAKMDVEKRSLGRFRVRVSPDGGSIAIVQLLPYEKEGREKFSLKVFDEQMDLQWERDVELPYLDDEFSVKSIRVTDDRSIIMIGTKNAEKKEAKELRKDGKATYEYHLLIHHGDGRAPEDHPITVEDKFLQELSLSIGSEGDILCGGFYGNKTTHSIRGAFFLRLDPETKEVVHASFKEFDQEFITSYMTEKEEAKASKKADKKGEELEMRNFVLRDIVRRTDGGVVLVAEQYRYYMTTTCTTNANGGQTCRTNHHYEYDDIIVVSIDPAGQISWAVKVPKRQRSVNDGGRYSSFSKAVKGENLHLLFNDSGKNLFLKQGDKVTPFTYGRDMLVTMVTVDGDGRVFREALWPQDKRDAILRPKAGAQIGDDRIFIHASWKKMHRFGSVIFN